jgi:hypothetical protein
MYDWLGEYAFFTHMLLEISNSSDNLGNLSLILSTLS